MNQLTRKRLGVLVAGITVVAGSVVLLAKVKTGASKPVTKAKPAAKATSKPGGATEVTPDKVAQIVRERFGVPENIKLTVDPLQESASPEFLETSVTSDDGKDKKTSPVCVSKDAHYLVLGNVFKLSAPGSNEEIIKDARQMFKMPDAIGITAGRPEPSDLPGFDKVKLTASNGGSQDFFLTRDRRTLILGQLLNLRFDPRIITTANQPSVGPAHAPVTIVEFADMECPSCARMQQFIENDLIPNPKYRGKVRIIFKDFPLGPSHPWGTTGAVASECGYEIDPAKFLTYRSTIFLHQNDVDAVQTDTSKVRDLLLGYGQQVGLDRTKLAACMDSQASLPRVEAGRKEGDRLTVQSTPTFFINGRIMVGIVPPEDFYKAVDEALKAAEPAKPARPSRRTKS
ncbi:MAG TPA: thioredoxin domain-containing protein [Terriglobia bacterium]|nr:thioredoxin domain-containing protein [Terriglobia bacterium]